MLFSSPEFILYFLPIVFVGYLLLVRWSGSAVSGAFLALASLFFYGWWKPIYLPLILASIGLNYGLTRCFLVRQDLSAQVRKFWLVGGIVFNLGLLGYFKYSWFAVETLATLVGSEFRMTPLLLPLAISFFTFQQIAFLVDAWKGEVREFRFSSYVLFVSFFPQLIAGPIVHHREMMPQFANNTRLSWPGWINMEQGIRIFLIGLGKKLILADSLAVYANLGWADVDSLQLWAAWGTTLCYTFQLYFDFSGYSDMALGAARFFGIHLPINFNSPYKALSIQDFWSRWHMTLSRWLKDYLYIPLGGNRQGTWMTYRNLFLTFLLGGIWHGAGWTFMIWGALHGVGCVVHRYWTRWGKSIWLPVAWMMTFLYVHVGWVFFRAPSVQDAWQMLRRMTGVSGMETMPTFGFVKEYFLEMRWWEPIAPGAADLVPQPFPLVVLPWVLLCFFVTLGFRSGVELTLHDRIKYPLLESLLFALLALACMLFSIRAQESPFLYFNF